MDSSERSGYGCASVSISFDPKKNIDIEAQFEKIVQKSLTVHELSDEKTVKESINENLFEKYAPFSGKLDIGLGVSIKPVKINFQEFIKINKQPYTSPSQDNSKEGAFPSSSYKDDCKLNFVDNHKVIIKGNYAEEGTLFSSSYDDCDVCLVDDHTVVIKGKTVVENEDEFLVDDKITEEKRAAVGVIAPPSKTNVREIIKLIAYTDEMQEKNIKSIAEKVIKPPVYVPERQIEIMKRREEYEDVRRDLKRLQKERMEVPLSFRTDIEIICDKFREDLSIFRSAVDHACRFIEFAENIKVFLVCNSNADAKEPRLEGELSNKIYESLNKMIESLDQLVAQQFYVDAYASRRPQELPLIMTYYCVLKTSFRYFVYTVFRVIHELPVDIYTEQYHEMWDWCEKLSDMLDQMMLCNFCYTREFGTLCSTTTEPVYGFFKIGLAWIPTKKPFYSNPEYKERLKSGTQYAALPCMCNYHQGETNDVHIVLMKL